MGAKNRFHGLYKDQNVQASAVERSKQENVQDKSEIEIIRRQIQKTLRDNPDMAKKAAMIIEKMLEKPSSK